MRSWKSLQLKKWGAPVVNSRWKMQNESPVTGKALKSPEEQERNGVEVIPSLRSATWRGTKRPPFRGDAFSDAELTISGDMLEGKDAPIFSLTLSVGSRCNRRVIT